MEKPSTGPVTVVVIAYNDAEHLAAAVRSALDQGDAVGEVVVVDDCSTDGTAQVLDKLAADPRVTAVSRASNSGGCGTPRNDGLAAATRPYVMFLDSDDVLPPGAADALLATALGHDTDVVAGRALRRELPDGRTTVWAPQLYDTAAGADLPGSLIEGIGNHPELLWDTLSVNKLYRRGFLLRHRITFPDGAYHYEDFVFTARVYAADPRIAVIETPVYVWHVRRAAVRLSISLRRATVDNWRSRVTAHAAVVDLLDTSGRPGLVRAARAKFLDYDLPMYLRELPQRSPEYRADWWKVTRDHLAGFDERSLTAAAPASRWIARTILALPEPEGVGPLVELAARPPRLLPPYRRDDEGRPVLTTGAATVPLDGLEELPTERLPVTVEGTITVGTATRLSLRVNELYGRLAARGPRALRVQLTERGGDRSALPEAPLIIGDAAERGSDGGWWHAELRIRTETFTLPGRLAVWDVRAEVVCADGSTIPVEVRAAAGQTARRGFVLRPTGRVLLVQTHVTSRHALVLRIADGMDGARRVVRGRLGRLFGKR